MVKVDSVDAVVCFLGTSVDACAMICAMIFEQNRTFFKNFERFFVFVRHIYKKMTINTKHYA
jgi:hypothetical protein